MKRSWIKLASLVILLFLVSVFLCEKTWAGGTSQTGGSSSGSGSVDQCSESYTTIHEPSCGAGGGGKSWRVYKINNNTTYGNLDNGATWEIDEGEYGGNKISGTNGIVSQCVRMKAPYILLFGLNRVAVSSSTTKKFYVTFKRSETDTCDLKDKCRCNRGCYYDWNNYDAITAVKGLTGNFKNGRAVTNDVAKELYKKEFGNLTNYSEKGAFCTWADIVTLTGKSVDIWGNSLASYSGLGDKTQSVASGSVATVTRGTNAVYTYKGWETSLDGAYTQSGHGTTSYSQTMNGNGVVYFVYEPPKYTLTGTAIDINGNSLSGVTGLENVSQTVYSGQTAEVERRTTEAGYTYKGWELTKDGSYRNADHKNTKYSRKMTGNTTMFFVYEPFRQTSELEIKVKNNSVVSQGNYAKEVYAKPGDKMAFWTSYSSNAQAGKNIKPQGIRIGDGGGVISSSGNKTVETLLNESKLSGMGNWSNGITLGGFAKFSHSYTVGEVSQYQEEDSSDDEIMPEHVGSAIEETVTTQTDSEGTTPKSVSIGLERNESVATVGLNLSDTAKIYVPYNFILNPSITELGDGNGGSKVFFAGETVVVGARIDFKSKANAITTDLNPETGEYESYVTKAKNVKTRLVVYPRRGDGEPDSGGVVSGGVNVNICNSYFGYSDSECSHSNIEDVKGQNDDDILYPSSEGFPINSPKIVVEDLPAGSELCVALAVFPATSGADNNWNDLNYDNTWRVSASKCYTVAKKPSLQVWGGSIYSDANIDVPLSSKKHLANYVNYDASRTEDESYIFGSWGELGLIANKSAKGFASGASLGYAGNNDGVTLPKPDANDGNSGEPGGYYSSSDDAGVLCVMSPLTIANENCNTGTVGNLETDTAVGGINKDRNALKNLAEALGIGGTNAVSGVLSTFQEENYYEAAGDLTIGQSEDITVPSDRTILVHSKENIQINKNIRYENTDYQSLLQTPKLIIYSDKTINIDCTVTRIDAVLLADTVDTCPTQDNNWNPRQNSNQLFIYGAVIANTLKANRTYGAAPGNNSIVPAEIIDFDPTLYLWQGANNADDDPVNQEDDDNNKSLNFDTVYSHEMVPRY